MTTETAGIRDAIQTLIGSYIEFPHALEVSAKEVPGAIYWLIRPHGQDYGKISGKLGLHLSALTFLIKSMCHANGQFATVTLLEPKIAVRFEPGPKKRVRDYDPTPAINVLLTILGHMGIGQHHVAALRQDQEPDQAFVEFNIFVRDPDSYKALTTPPAFDHHDQTAIGALGTLFRAMANKVGIKCQLEVVLP